MLRFANANNWLVYERADAQMKLLKDGQISIFGSENRIGIPGLWPLKLNRKLCPVDGMGYTFFRPSHRLFLGMQMFGPE